MVIIPIVPNGNLRLLSNVNTDYKNAMDFTSILNQQTFFISKTKYNIGNVSFVNHGQNFIDVNYNIENLNDVNYMMFQNTNFGNKWFYCFITNVEWINTKVSRIFYEIDSYQTYIFDVTINPSFVEREHLSSQEDIPGANTVEENLETGEIVYRNVENSGMMQGTQCILVACTKAIQEGEFVNSKGSLMSGVFNGCSFHVFGGGIVGFEKFQDFMEIVSNNGGADDIVISACMFYAGSDTKRFFEVNDSMDYPLILDNSAKIQDINMNKEEYTSGSLNGYTPKNKKLYTYPYNYLMVTNGLDDYKEYKYEFFHDSNMKFKVIPGIACNPEILLVPTNYNLAGNSTTDSIINGLPESLKINGFPQCSFNIDTFKAWLAQNGSSVAIQTMGNLLQGAVGSMTGNPFALANAGAGLISTVDSVAKMGKSSPSFKGGSNGGVNLWSGGMDFIFHNCCISVEYARKIDDFFSMYGYKTNRVKTPNTRNRSSWNYVKTSECKVIGNAPQPHKEKIADMFNHGVTFWHGDYVGDYTRENI